MIYARDDGMIRSHEEAKAVLEYAVPGARVEIYRPHLRVWNQMNREGDRAYSISLERMGRDPVIALGSYSLPAPAERIAQHARAEVEKRLET